MADTPMRPDVAAAWETIVNKSGRKRDIRKLPEYLAQEETVLNMAGGVTASNAGLLVATNRRVLFVSEGIINHSFEDFPYDRITTVTTTRGMLFGKVLITAAGATRVIEQVGKSEAEAISAVIREQVEAITRQRSAPPSPAPVPAASARSLAAELRELAELRDAGVLTEDEFQEQKRKLLAR